MACDPIIEIMGKHKISFLDKATGKSSKRSLWASLKIYRTILLDQPMWLLRNRAVNPLPSKTKPYCLHREELTLKPFKTPFCGLCRDTRIAGRLGT